MKFSTCDSLSRTNREVIGVSSKDIQKARQTAKRNRSAVACERCKAAKTKCSDYRPCKNCMTAKTLCEEGLSRNLAHKSCREERYSYKDGDSVSKTRQTQDLRMLSADLAIGQTDDTNSNTLHYIRTRQQNSFQSSYVHYPPQMSSFHLPPIAWLLQFQVSSMDTTTPRPVLPSLQSNQTYD
jgi:hypothetical protein